MDPQLLRRIKRHQDTANRLMKDAIKIDAISAEKALRMLVPTDRAIRNWQEEIIKGLKAELAQGEKAPSK